MRFTVRSLHRDLGYFYVGLIIAFAFSGIFLNHRKTWFPRDYKYNAQEITVKLPQAGQKVDGAYVASVGEDLGISDGLKAFRVRDNQLRITYDNNIVDIDLKTGKGIKESYFQVPVLAQFTTLHLDTNVAWIWYSDIFGAALLTIAITGMFIQQGRTSFKKRGWILAAIGIAFPLIFLFVIS